MKSTMFLSAVLAIVFHTGACGQPSHDKGENEKWKSEIKDWQAGRIRELKTVSSPLSLTGIFPIKSGENSFGSAKDNDIVIPAEGFPAHAGKYIFNADSLTVSYARETGIKSIGKQALVTKQILAPNANPLVSDSSLTLQYGSFNWIVQVTDGKPSVRVRDLNSEGLKKFSGVSFYPLENKWLVKASYHPYDAPTSIGITTVFGNKTQKASPGVVHFSFDGKQYTLEALDRGSQLFFTFSDQTGDSDSYAFRFLFVNKPSANNKDLWLDFNKATNPNCAFSPYTPCPLPPKQNILPLKIEAGEKKYASK